MNDDPIIAEIRRHRDEHAAKFNYDLAAIAEDFRKSQAARGVVGVTLPKRPAHPKGHPVAS